MSGTTQGRNNRPSSSVLKRSAQNVMESPTLSTHDHPIEFVGKSSLAGLTTKLLRYGTKSEKEERRRLLEEEKVLHLQAALVMSMKRKGGAPKLHLTSEERDKKEKEDKKKEEREKLKREGKDHHWELTTEDSRKHAASQETTEKVHEAHEYEVNKQHVHNMSHVKAFHAPSPFTENTGERAKKIINKSIETIAAKPELMGSLPVAKLPEKEEPKKAPTVALEDLKKGLAGLKKAPTASSPPIKLQLGDIKAGLAGLSKVQPGSGTSPQQPQKPQSDQILEERQKAWVKFEAAMKSSLHPNQLQREMPPLAAEDDEAARGGEGVRQQQGVKLGEGKFGVAYLYRLDKKENSNVVFKIASFGDNNPHRRGQTVISRKDISDEARKLAPAVLLEEFQREVACLLALQHPNILGFRAVLLPPAPLTLATEYLAGGSLGQALAAEDWTVQNVPQKQRVGLLKGILRGLAFMHSKGFIHRDLKAHNILLGPHDHTVNGDSRPGAAWEVAKIADFGTAVKLAPDQKLYEEVGTTGYTAPEIMSPEGYDGAVDVFAFSVLIWELFKSRDARNPMVGVDVTRLEDNCRPQCESSHPSSVVVIARRGWQREAVKRPTFAAISALLGVEDKRTLM